MGISRRGFVGAGAAAVAGMAVSKRAGAATPPRAAARPAVIASANGIRGVERAYEMLTTRNEDTLEAILAGVTIQELDPQDQSVGLGGLPNEQGVVQLDASLMHGPTRRAGAVAALEDIATASLVARAVMEHTDHILLVGSDAKRFALRMGFPEQNLLTEKSRQDWLRWKACLNPSDNWLDAPFIQPRTGMSGEFEGLRQKFTNGTIHMSAVNAAGDMSSVTTTSGLSWKIPGRVGDSAIVGAGQYCDQEVGAAGSTGRGEANIKVCGAFLIVELMRQGMAPEAACLRTIERTVAMTERRLLDDRGRPRFDLSFYALARDGSFGGATLYSGGRFAVADASGARLVSSAFLFNRSERPASAASACRQA